MRSPTDTLGLALLGMAALLALLGALLLLGGRLGLGNLPGDFRFSGQGWSCFLPMATSVLLSLVLTLLFNLLLRRGR